MPFTATEAARCPKCGHQVFAAEEMLAGGSKWHKICFTCGLCRKRLDSTNSTEHNGMLWCKICYSRKFGPKGVGFGGGAGTLNMDKGEVFGNFESAPNKPQDPYYGINSKFFNFGQK